MTASRGGGDDTHLCMKFSPLPLGSQPPHSTCHGVYGRGLISQEAPITLCLACLPNTELCSFDFCPAEGPS